MQPLHHLPGVRKRTYARTLVDCRHLSPGKRRTLCYGSEPIPVSGAAKLNLAHVAADEASVLRQLCVDATTTCEWLQASSNQHGLAHAWVGMLYTACPSLCNAACDATCYTTSCNL